MASDPRKVRAVPRNANEPAVQPHERGQLTTLLCSIIASPSPPVPLGMPYLRAPRFRQYAARLPWSGVSAGISRSAVASPFARGKLDPGREPPMLPGPGMPRRGVAPAFSVCVERARPPITPCAPAGRGGTATQRCPLRDRFHQLVPADFAETRHPVAGSVVAPWTQVSPCRSRTASHICPFAFVDC